MTLDQDDKAWIYQTLKELLGGSSPAPVPASLNSLQVMKDQALYLLKQGDRAGYMEAIKNVNKYASKIEREAKRKAA